MDKVAVLGGGSLGLLLGGKLKASGCDCAIWTRSRGQADLLNAKGLTLEDQTGAIVSRNAIRASALEEARLSETGVVFLAVKQTALTAELLQGYRRSFRSAEPWFSSRTESGIASF